MIRWITGAASLHVGAVLLIFAGVAWLAPTATMKNQYYRCVDLHAASSDELPEWVHPESMGADFDIARQQLTCTWTSASGSGSDQYVWTHDFHDTQGKLALATVALLGVCGFASGIAWRARQRGEATL